MRICKYANIQIHEYRNTNIRIKNTNLFTDHLRPSDHSINGSLHIQTAARRPKQETTKDYISVLGQFGSYPFFIRKIVLNVSPSAKELPFSVLRTLCGKKPKLWCFNKVLRIFLFLICNKLPP